MKTYNMGLVWSKKISGEEFNYETYFFLSVNNKYTKRWYAKYMVRRTFVLRRQYFYGAIYTKDFGWRRFKTIVRGIYEIKLVF